MEKRTRTNNDLQNTTQKANDRATRTPLKPGGALECSGGVNSSCYTSGNCRVATLNFSVNQLAEYGVYMHR